MIHTNTQTYLHGRRRSLRWFGGPISVARLVGCSCGSLGPADMFDPRCMAHQRVSAGAVDIADAAGPGRACGQELQADCLPRGGAGFAAAGPSASSSGLIEALSGKPSGLGGTKGILFVLRHALRVAL